VTVGVEYNKMRLINLDESQQEIPLHVRDRLLVQQQKKDQENLDVDFDFA
jgi:UDP-N-acetylglucosamine transferase subunit ALG13